MHHVPLIQISQSEFCFRFIRLIKSRTKLKYAVISKYIFDRAGVFLLDSNLKLIIANDDSIVDKTLISWLENITVSCIANFLDSHILFLWLRQISFRKTCYFSSFGAFIPFSFPVNVRCKRSLYSMQHILPSYHRVYCRMKDPFRKSQVSNLKLITALLIR